MRLALIVALPCFLAACSVHPLPEDVTRDDTLSIARKIRCEAKETLQEIFLMELARDPQDLKSMAVHDSIRKENRDFTKADVAMISEKALKRLIPLFKSGIGTAFTFTATEVDNGAASAKFGLPFTDGALSLSMSAGKNLNRKNVRTVTLAESWFSVATINCSEVNVVHRNLLYPITGTVGLDEVIVTYLRLSSDLRDQERVKDLKAFSDKLTFTTELLGGIQPVLELKPVANKFKLASANGNFGASRKDEHDLLVTLTPPVPETEDMTVKLAENVKLVVTVPKGKYTRPKSSSTSGRPTKSFDFNASPALKEQLFNELNRLQSLDTEKQILESIDE